MQLRTCSTIIELKISLCGLLTSTTIIFVVGMHGKICGLVLDPARAVDLCRQAPEYAVDALKVSRVTMVHHLESEDEYEAVYQGNEGMYSAFKVEFDKMILSNHPLRHECSLSMEEGTYGWLRTFEIEPKSLTTGHLRQVAIGFDVDFPTLCILSSLALKVDHDSSIDLRIQTSSGCRNLQVTMHQIHSNHQMLKIPCG